MSTSAAAALEWLVRPFSGDPGTDQDGIDRAGIDRKALAGLLVQLARSVEPQSCAEPNGVPPVDPRLEQLRTLLVGHEIEVLSRLSEVVEDPEQLAGAVGRVLPTAIALASNDARLGQVLAPAWRRPRRAQSGAIRGRSSTFSIL